MRVVVASDHPALALALGAHSREWQIVETRDVDEVAELAEPGDVVLVEFHDAEDASSAVTALRRLGVSNGLVVIAEGAETARGLDDVVWISRPFALGDLAVALDSVHRQVASRARDALTGGAGPSVSGGGDAETDDVPASVVEVPEVAVPDAPDVLEDLDAGDAEPARSESSRRPRMGALRRRREAPEAPTRDAPVADDRSLRRRVGAALEGARSLEDLIHDMPAVTDPTMCGEAVLAEIRAQVPYTSAAVSLAGVSGALQVVAGDGVTPGESITPVPPTHPLVRRVRDAGGVLMISPTDDARGWIAGIPASSQPTLLAGIVESRDQVEALLLVGHGAEPDPAQVRLFGQIIDESADLLVVTAILRRLPRAVVVDPTIVHSWMRG